MFRSIHFTHVMTMVFVTAKNTEDNRDFQASVLDFSTQGVLAIGNEVGRVRGPEFLWFSIAKIETCLFVFANKSRHVQTSASMPIFL